MVHGNKAKLNVPSLALLQCKPAFEIFELGLIAVQIANFNFRDWLYCGANQTFKNLSMKKFHAYKKYTGVYVNKVKLNRPSLALLRCKPKSDIFELGLIALQNDFQNDKLTFPSNILYVTVSPQAFCMTSPGSFGRS